VKPLPSDERAIGRSIRIASAASDGLDVPVGAIVLASAGEVIAEATNRREADSDPTAHAEVLALRQAAARLGSWRLEGCTLAVSLEPCPMCAGAAVNARVSKIVFGAWNPDYGACGSVWDLPRDRHIAHRTEVVGGVLAKEAGAVIASFFADRRNPPAN
jgi:tRNA(adenine34) deaminase